MDVRDREGNCFQITWPTTLPECRGICRRADGEFGARGSSSSDEIEEDAKAGCPKCVIIYHSCHDFKGQARGSFKLKVTCNAKQPGIFDVEMILHKRRQKVQLYVEAGSPKPPWEFIRPARTPTIARREEFVQILTPWITHCNKTHEGCVTMGSKLPSRVLFVGSKIEPHLYLHVSSEEETGAYLALSYCWGQPHPPKTITSNLPKHEKAIDFNKLPRTFQDAIVVARAIDIRYLWIDSLCILQDEASDWQAESSKMAGYYTDAFLVIAASHASNTAEGLLDTVKGRLPIFSPGIGAEIGQIRNPDGSISHIFKRKLAPVLWTGRHEYPLTCSNLNRRAWALQENMLAKRIVHFVDAEMLWECVEDLKCECMEVDHTAASVPIPSSGIIRKSQFIPLYIRHRRGQENVNAHKLWLELLREYSTRALTYDFDLLPALSGLAKLWQSRGAGKYLAGFWQDYILESMTWRRLEVSKLQRSQEYRAPSWSPFSLDGEYVESRRFWGGREQEPHIRHVCFEFPDNESQQLVEKHAVVADAGVTLKGIDPTGQITDGFLQLRGRISQGHMTQNTAGRVVEVGGRTFLAEWDLEMDFDEGLSLTLILIGSNMSGGLIALILKPSQQEGFFERVGYIYDHRKDGVEAFVQSAGGEETLVTIV